MSWLRVDRDKLNNTLELFESQGIYKDREYRVYSPGWNSIVTGKQHTRMSFVLLLFRSESAEMMAKMLIHSV